MSPESEFEEVNRSRYTPNPWSKSPHSSQLSATSEGTKSPAYEQFVAVHQLGAVVVHFRDEATLGSG